MDKYNIIKNFITHKLDDQPIPSIYNDIKQDVKTKLELFETEFKEKCLKLQEETMNQLISGELEYKIDPEPYVENFPIVHLKSEELMKIDLKKYNIESQNIKIYIRNQYNCLEKLQNFPNLKNHKLCEDEYVIYMILKNISSDDGYLNNKYYIIYITNYGRIIHSHEYRKDHQCNSNGYENQSLAIYRKSDNIILMGNEQNVNKITITDYPPLEYRMPRLFLKILEAYNQENTDLLQECCKDYFIKHMESKKKDDELKYRDEIINKQTELLQEKDQEIAKLKKQIIELKKFYMNC